MNRDLERVDGGGSVSTPPAGPRPDQLAGHERLERWIDTLESLFRIPGTELRFGLDVILGLLPVVGDFAGLVCGLPLVVTAVRRRLRFTVVLAMVANLLIDTVFGVVPVLGNVFDLLWKSHRKNLDLLREPESLPEVLREAGWKASALAAIVVLLAMALVLLLVFFVWSVVWIRARFW